MVHNATSAGTELLAYNLSRPNLTSPLLSFDEGFNPRASGWSNVFSYPIEPGDTYEARIEGTTVNVSWTSELYEGFLETDTALEGIARDAEGEQLARFRFADLAAPVLAFASVSVEGQLEQRFELEQARLDADWNQPPAWTLGDWWRYSGTFQGNTGEGTVVYTGNQTSGRSQTYVLSPVKVEDRVLLLPFQSWRQRDIAPQSGVVSSLLSSFWSWPLRDGKTWTGSTTTVDGSQPYQARASLDERVLLPDGRATVAFTVRTYTEEQAEPFGLYRYAPLVEQLTRWNVTQVGEDAPAIDFTLEDLGEGYHGEMEIPQREIVAQIPEGNRSFLSGPASIERSFHVPEKANRLQVGSRSFAVHERGVDPEFTFRLTDPNGTVVYERNETQFEGRRLGLATVLDAPAGNWTLEISAGEGVSVLGTIYANWFVTRTVDYR